MRLALIWIALAHVSACSAESKLRKEGATPYVRCIAGPVPDSRSLRVGPWTLETKERVLAVTGPNRALRLAALSAPGLSDPLDAAALQRVRDANPDILLILGGIGEGPPLAAATLKAFASLSIPTLIVLGGRDTWAAHEKALEELPAEARIIDATVLRAVRIGKQTFVPLPGAERGRYALQAAACGYDQPDLDEAAKDLGPIAAGETRWLLSWQAPAQIGAASGPRTADGGSLGSSMLARFASQVGAKGALYAWPADEARAGSQAGPLGVASVPRLYGPRVETSTGSRLPNALLLLEVGPDGVRVL